MKRPEFRPLAREDFPDAPWIEKLLRPLNSVLSAVSVGLGNGLTLGENLNAEIKTLDVTTRDEWVPLARASGINVASTPAPAYRLEGGCVRLRGAVSGTLAVGVDFATGLPAPPGDQWLTGGGFDGTNSFGLRLRVQAGGGIHYLHASGVQAIGLDGLTYPTSVNAPNGAFPVRFTTKVKGKVAGLLVLRCVELVGRDERAVKLSVSAQWSQNGGTVNLDGVSGLSGGRTYRLTLAVLGG